MRLREGREFFEGTENPKGKSAPVRSRVSSVAKNKRVRIWSLGGTKKCGIASSGKNCGVRFREPEGREKKKRSSLSLEGSEKW